MDRRCVSPDLDGQGCDCAVWPIYISGKTEPLNTDTREAPMRTEEIEQRAPLRERDHILNTAKRLISGDREQTYGTAIDDFTRTGKMWAAILGLEEVTAEQVALCMAALKIGRLCNTPNHADSWVDACGYLALGGDIAATDGRHF